MAAYYAKAWNLWFSYPMTRFVAEYTGAGSDTRRQVEVTELMAVRIRNFRWCPPGTSSRGIPRPG